MDIPRCSRTGPPARSGPGSGITGSRGCLALKGFASWRRQRLEETGALAWDTRTRQHQPQAGERGDHRHDQRLAVQAVCRSGQSIRTPGGPSAMSLAK